MPDRYLIVNADDFGLCRETNDAIETLFNEKRITSTTIMAPARAFKDAAARALNNKIINTGLHITLNSDCENDRWRSTAPKEKVMSLLDDDGSFFYDLCCFYRNAREDEVAVEINAQYDFAVSSGCSIDHADSHCGTLYGIGGKPFLKEAYELCKKHNLPFRFPKSKSYIKGMFGGSVPPEIDFAHTSAVMFAQMIGVHLLSDMMTNPYKLKDIKSYENLRDFYINAIRNMKEGITELFLHPSGFSRLLSANPEWQKRIWEYEFLMSDDFLKTIEQEDIKLVSYGRAPFSKYI
jgi:Uncharacterized protein conserved in bacteria